MSCLRLLRPLRARLDTARERGAVLALVAGTLVLLLISGAVAVDLSALDRQGQTLQNTADAAALAGVATWVDSGDQAAAAALVEDMIIQNGVEIGDEVSLDITFPSPLEISVELRDSQPDVFLSGSIGINNTLHRAAVARLEACDAGCNREAVVPQPFGSVRAIGSGDGFVPVVVGNRLYGVNHHSSTLSCVDRTTNTQCWSSKPLFNLPAKTGNYHYAEVVGKRIFYAGYSISSRQTVIACFDTVTDSRCGTTAFLGNHGYGTLINSDKGLLLFTSTRKVFCVNPATMTQCPSYSGGRDSRMSTVPGWSADSRAAAYSFRVVHGNRVYSTIANRGQDWVHCWDLDTDHWCSSFVPRVLNDTRLNSNDAYSSGRLFFNRDTSGNPLSLCSLGLNNVECRDLVTGDQIAAHESQFDAFHTAITSRPWRAWAAMNSYHAPSNRMFAVNSRYSRTYCYDFNTSSYCGEVYNTTPFGETQTYGYIGEGNCLIGLGDNSIFFTMKPDMSGECVATGTEVDVTPCMCDGAAKWPPVSAKNTDGLILFDVRVEAPDGTLLLPADGAWHDMLLDPIDLSSIDLSYPYVTIVISVEADATAPDPWVGSEPPTFVIGIRDQDPQLID